MINGYKNPNGENIEGFGGNLKYYKTAFVPSEPTDKNKELLTKESVEMLCLRENTFDFVADFFIMKVNERGTKKSFADDFAEVKKIFSKTFFGRFFK